MPVTATWLTFSVTPLTLTCNGQVVGRATGFFLKLNETWFVVSNWHVLSGRDPRDGQARHVSGGVPDTCHFQVPAWDGAQLRWAARGYLLGDALSGSATWKQHPNDGQSTDVAAFQVEGPLPIQVRDLLDPDGHDEIMWVDIGGEVFLPGYPLGLSAGGALPVWKRASLASSTELSVGKCLLVDTATRQGMSGAPCIAISTRYYFRRTSGSMKMTRIEDPFRWRLMGVYSGRLNPSDTYEAQIGIVWRKELIMETIERGTPGTVDLVKPA